MPYDYKAARDRLELELDRRMEGAPCDSDASRFQQYIALNRFLNIALEKMAGKVEFTPLDLYEWVEEFAFRYPITEAPRHVG